MIRLLSQRVEKGPETSAKSYETRSTVHTSLALNVLYHQLRPDRKYNILDLGPAFGSNVEFFSQFSCKIYIEDLFQTLTSFDFFSPEDGFGYDAVFEYLLPFRNNTRFEIVLVWDLLNYLEHEEFRHLIRHLSRFTHSGSLLFALLSTQKHIPEKPINFKIVDSQSLIYETSASVLRPCPQYEQSDLRHLMPNFRVCNSFILRNGMKEYLFVRE